MKFKNYLKILRIYYLIEIIGVLVMVIFLIAGSKGIFTMTLRAYERSDLVTYLRAANEVLGRLQFAIKFFLTSLIGFFITKNFKTIYGSIKSYL